MISVAIKMLLRDRRKSFLMIVGLTFASLLITQQMAIFLGIMGRTIGFITDTNLPDLWVMDPKVKFIDDIKPLQDTEFLRIRGVEGVAWAVPLYKGTLRARLEDGSFQVCNVAGLDDSTLIGSPSPLRMVQGRVEDLRHTDGVIVDEAGAATKLSRPPRKPGGPRTPLGIGDVLELNDHRAVVVGICKITRTFQSQPLLYTTYSRATTFAPRERKLLSFVLAKAKPGVDPAKLCARIRGTTGLAAYTNSQFSDLTIGYFMRNIQAPINFGISVLLSFIVGAAIATQTFSNFTLENLRYLGTFKAMGASSGLLLRMTVLQTLLVGAVGFGTGVGVASLFGVVSKGTELAFQFPWQLLAGTAGAIFLICILSSLVSLRRVVVLEPAMVFKS
ncbi:MAG TPA: ABC transporter permease [Planctomycetota bacterium]|nr:ABC transporter permease [Planctomycetota bacterium]